ncbi:MAG: tRNA (adenine-N1)-methyltransferase [Candidatus Omnitrophota bacterium]|nr:tRNA (adenine-N1)-methyltransferase [Candidatus Omnitrophota bacterium]
MIAQGDLVFVYKDERRNYLIKVQGGQMHTDLGYVDLTQLVGKEYGQAVATNLGHRFYLLRPYLYEMVMKIKRKTQIIYPKDIGTIITRANISPGARVIECGSGSGALTTALANFVRPAGKVYSYDRNQEFSENAKKNIERYGLSEYVDFKVREVIDIFDEKEVDFVMIDIGSQWDLIDAAYGSLKGGCRLASICPTYEQLTRFVFTLEEKGFTNIESMEVLLRRILVRRGKTRPEQQMPSHTGWLVFASKIERDPSASTITQEPTRRTQEEEPTEESPHE